MDNIVLLQKLRRLPGVKKVFIRSGLRFDYLLLDRRPDYLRELCEHHISGQLKVAPEHTVDHVLAAMGKPGFEVYQRFSEQYSRFNKKLNKKQYLVPYFIAAHPGSRMADAVAMAEAFASRHLQPEQVQLFIPTPGTRSTCMYYTGLDPRNMEPVYVARDPKEREIQRAMLQFANPKNYPLVRQGLKMAGREDLIGFGKNCLVPPPKGQEAEYKMRAEKAVKNRKPVKISKDKYGNEIKPKQPAKNTVFQAKKAKKRVNDRDNRARNRYSRDQKDQGA